MGKINITQSFIKLFCFLSSNHTKFLFICFVLHNYKYLDYVSMVWQVPAKIWHSLIVNYCEGVRFYKVALGTKD